MTKPFHDEAEWKGSATTPTSMQYAERALEEADRIIDEAQYHSGKMPLTRWAGCHVPTLREGIAQAIKEAREDERKWQPIETHPKHDDDVVLYFSNDDIAVGFWRDDAQAWDSCDLGWFKVPPTHWMPLPPAPRSQHPIRGK